MVCISKRIRINYAFAVRAPMVMEHLGKRCFIFTALLNEKNFEEKKCTFTYVPDVLISAGEINIMFIVKSGEEMLRCYATDYVNI
jgi:hypothetical protein